MVERGLSSQLHLLSSRRLPDSPSGPRVLAGSGSFTKATSFAGASVLRKETNAVAVGDLNNDGHLDVIFGNKLENEVYLGDGSGGFSAIAANSALVSATDTTKFLLLADMNGDGGPHTLWSWPLLSSPLRSHSSLIPLLTVLHSDSRVRSALDVIEGILGAGVKIHVNDANGLGTFTTASNSAIGLPTSGWTMALGVGDVEGDGMDEFE